MNKLLYLLLAITVACSSSDDSSASNCNVVYLDSNGVTIKACPDAELYDEGVINGNRYMIVNKNVLSRMIQNNEDLTKVCTSLITDMSGLFSNDTNFNQDIGNWDVSNVTDMTGMFFYAISFNQDIGNWDVSNVTDMDVMFHNAVRFNQDLSEWSVDNVIGCNNFDYFTPQWTLPKPNFTNCTP